MQTPKTRPALTYRCGACNACFAECAALVAHLEKCTLATYWRNVLGLKKTTTVKVNDGR